MRGLLIALILVLSGCATRSPDTNALMKDSRGLTKKELEVPFEDQDDYLCAPASLSMVLQYKGHHHTRDDIRHQLVTDKAHGTFQMNLVSEVRYMGLLGIPIVGMEDLLKEVNAGNPVIVFQNLGTSFYPVWHYAVVTGFNLTRRHPVIKLHSGHHPNQSQDMREFEESWSLADSWGLIVLNPGELSSTQDELAHVRAAAGLEQIRKFNEARRSYEAILKKWPNSLAAMLGLGNVAFTQKDYQESLRHLELAAQTHPDSSMAWHNLAVLEGALGKISRARKSAERAMELAAKEDAPMYRESLKKWLTL